MTKKSNLDLRVGVNVALLMSLILGMVVYYTSPYKEIGSFFALIGFVGTLWRSPNCFKDKQEN